MSWLKAQRKGKLTSDMVVTVRSDISTARSEREFYPNLQYFVIKSIIIYQERKTGSTELIYHAQQTTGPPTCGGPVEHI